MSIFPNPSPNPQPSGGSAAPQPAPAMPPPQYAAAPQYPPPPAYYPPPPAPSSGWKVPVLFIAVLALIGANVYLYMQLTNVKSDLVKASDAAQARLDKLEEVTNVTTRSNRRTVDELRDQLERARRQANLAAGEAKDEALKKVEETRVQLVAAQQQQAQQLKTDISQVKDAADSANTKISQVGSDVTSVKGDVAATRTELEKTVADLKRATGELDGHSVLIATNGKELQALRTLGERNYVEFNIHKSKTAQRVGDISVLLKSTDPKKNRYTIMLTADDKTVEKKDRVVNEPLQFMTSKAKQPYEIVVNDIKKDNIAGYLSIPKVLNTRN